MAASPARDRFLSIAGLAVGLLVVVLPLVSGLASAQDRGPMRPFEAFEFAPGTYDLQIEGDGTYGMAVHTYPDSPACQEDGRNFNFYPHGRDRWIAVVEACKLGFGHVGDLSAGRYRVEVGGTGRAMLVMQHTINLGTGESPSTIEDTFNGRLAHWFDGALGGVDVTVEASAPVRGWVYDNNLTLVEDLGEGTELSCTCEFWRMIARQTQYVVLESDAEEPVQVAITVVPAEARTATLADPPVPLLALSVVAVAGVGAAWWWVGNRRQ